MKKILSALCLSLALITTTPALASNDYTFDKAHTQVMFSVSHLGFSFSHGKFLGFDGGFTFDEAHPEKSTINVTIDIATLNMDDEKWDAHLKGADFFDVEKFPTMTFKSTAIEITGENAGKVTGDLTLHGVTKPVTLDVTYNKSGVHPYSKMYVSGFSATGLIKRSDFDMTYGLPGVGDDVNISIQVEGVRQDPQTQPK